MPPVSSLHVADEQRAKSQIWANATSGSGGIRKIIHQTWKTKDLPGKFKVWSESWKTCLPGWEYRLHTDSDNRNFIAKHFPDFLATYDEYKYPIERVDAIRYALLAVEGGLYVDLDIECLKDPSPIFETMQEASLLLVNEGGRQASNAIIGTDGKSDTFTKVVGELPKYKDKELLTATGPILLTRALQDISGIVVGDWGKPDETKAVRTTTGGSATLAGDEFFLALKWNNQGAQKQCLDRESCLKLYPNSYSVSHWTNTWSGNAVPQTRSMTNCDEMLHMLSGVKELANLDGRGRVRFESADGARIYERSSQSVFEHVHVRRGDSVGSQWPGPASVRLAVTA